MEPQDLEALFVRYRERNDAAALAAVFDATAPALLAVARRLSRNRSDAEDLLQATFVTAIERAATFDSSRSIVPWLAGILAGHAKNAARRAAWRRTHEIPGNGREAGDDPIQLESLLRLEERAAVARAVRELPEPYRELIEARLAPSPAAIGASPDRASATALAVRLHRGIARLRRLLPASLFGGLLGVTLERRALAAIREAILARCSTNGAGAAMTSTAAVVPYLVAGGLVKKKLSAVVLLLLGLTTAWVMVDPHRHARDATLPEAAIAPRVLDPEVREPAKPEPAVDRSVAPSQAVRSTGINFRGRVLGPDGVALGGVRAALTFVTRQGQDSPFMRWDDVFVGPDGRFETALERNYSDLQKGIRLRVDGYASLERAFDLPGPTVAHRDGVDLGDLRLQFGSNAFGFVVDAAGKRIADAAILLVDHRSSGTFLPAESQDVARSDREGAFAIEHVRGSGIYYHYVYAISERGCGGARFTSTEGTDVRELRIEVAAPGTVAVEVVNEDGSPAVGMPIFALPGGLNLIGSKDPPNLPIFVEQIPSAVAAVFYRSSDASGCAVFEHLPSGIPYVITVRTPYEVFGQARVEPFAPDDRIDRRVVLRKKPDSRRSIAGQVVDADGRAVPNVTVEWHDGLDRTPRDPHAVAVADGSGRYRFDDVLEGSECVLCVGDPRFKNDGMRISWSGEMDLENIALRARPALPVAGVVVDDSGAAIADARVFVDTIPCDGSRTDAEGRFHVQNSGPENQRIWAQLPGDRLQWLWPVISQDLRPGAQDHRLVAVRDAPGSATVEISVIDASTRAPLSIASAEIYERNRGSGPPRLGGLEPLIERGKIRLERWRDGSWRVGVTLADRRRVDLDFEVPKPPSENSNPAPIIALELPVAASGSVDGRIVAPGTSDADLAEAMKRASVWVSDEDGWAPGGVDFEPSMFPLAGATRFQFARVPPRMVRFKLRAGDWIGDVVLDARRGGEMTVEIVAERSGSVRFVGRENTGDADLGVRLTRIGKEGPPIWFRPRFSAPTEPVPPGTWRYEVWNYPFMGSFAWEPLRAERLSEGELTTFAGGTTDLQLPPARR